MRETDLNTLLSRVAAGDMDAFAQFYDATCDRVYGMILRVLRDQGYSCLLYTSPSPRDRG